MKQLMLQEYKGNRAIRLQLVQAVTVHKYTQKSFKYSYKTGIAGSIIAIYVISSSEVIIYIIHVMVNPT